MTATKQKPLVAIHCATYNHEPYLRQCLDGFVMQQTNFPFIAIIHDDASTDGSATIIKEYAEKFPNIIRPIYETENQYSKPGQIFRIMLNASKDAKYIAYCEGDDYWTDPQKLQRQVDFLETHPLHSAIAENGMVHNEITKTNYIFNKTFGEQDVNMQDVLTYRKFPTAGVMVRTDSLIGAENNLHYFADTIIWCWLISKGNFRYSPIVSSVYRHGMQGITEYTSPIVFAKKVENWHQDILRNFDINRHFLFLQTAKVYKSFLVKSWKQNDYISAIKCLWRGGLFTIKGLLS